MSEEALSLFREKAIREKAEKLFSPGLLSDKINQAFELSQMQGLDIFFTEVPWRIILPNAPSIKGSSENLQFAAKDIYSHLVVLSANAPPETIVDVGIDERRLSAPHRAALNQGSRRG